MLNRLTRLPIGERITYFDERVPLLHAMLGSVGHARETSPRYDWDGLRRGRQEFALFQYTLSGEGRLRVGGREHAVTPGAAMMLHFPAENRYWLPATGGHWEFIYLCLHGREIMRLWPRVEGGHGALTTLPADAKPVVQAGEIVRRAMSGEIASAFDGSALAYAWVMRMLETVPMGDRASPHAEAMERARRHAESHLAEPLGVDDLAKIAGFSRFHFTRLFTVHTGASPTAWLMDLRVKEAARLLRESRLSLKEVAVRCGFGDAGYFGKVFAGRMGQPPASYRRSGV
ncbi:MAG: AraC family transcriptional regulator [Rariglobus sp.]|nr:AraC family transcriptional regulator [Rariglobus sp.]